MPFYELACTVTPDLAPADDLLHRYSRLANSDRRGPARCGSAEGQYRAPGGLVAEARREPAPLVAISAQDRQTVQAALASMPVHERIVISAVYIRPGRAGRVLRDAGIQFADAALLHKRALQHVQQRLGR